MFPYEKCELSAEQKYDLVAEGFVVDPNQTIYLSRYVSDGVDWDWGWGENLDKYKDQIIPYHNGQCGGSGPYCEEDFEEIAQDIWIYKAKKSAPLKVYSIKCDGRSFGGMAIVAAKDKEEAEKIVCLDVDHDISTTFTYNNFESAKSLSDIAMIYNELPVKCEGVARVLSIYEWIVTGSPK